MQQPRDMRQTDGGGTKSNKKNEKIKDKNVKKKLKMKWGWVAKVSVAAFTASAVLTVLSSQVLEQLSAVIAFFILFLFIALNIFFDIIGLAVTTAEEKPFHSMASRKLKVGSKAVFLIHNAEKVSNFCADVVGDIAGVISGSTGAAIIIKLFSEGGRGEFWGNIVITAVIAAVTVGGKAAGKTIAIRYNRQIVTYVAKFLCIFDRTESKRKSK